MIILSDSIIETFKTRKTFLLTKQSETIRLKMVSLKESQSVPSSCDSPWDS